MKQKIVFEPLVNGFTWVLAGGTRTTIKLDRPWQKPLESLIKPDKCPFCTKPQEKIVLPGIPDGWWLLPNPITPHRKHRLIVPDKCWPAEYLQDLGGFKEIYNALEITRLATAEDKMEIALVIHVGWLAGQNLGHPHWHICDAQIRKPFEKTTIQKERIIAKNSDFLFLATGAKPGQILILPNEPCKLNNNENLSSLAYTISSIVGKCNEKFRSTDQNLPPEFAVTVRISPDHMIRYASYCPVLAPSSSGFTYTIATLEGGPCPLPWAHETTAAYLRK